MRNTIIRLTTIIFWLVILLIYGKQMLLGTSLNVDAVNYPMIVVSIFIILINIWKEEIYDIIHN